MKAYIKGAATTKFGELWSTSPRFLAKKACREALEAAGLTEKKIEAVFVGNMLSSSLGGQDHIGAFFAEELGISAPALKVEGACASGSLAFHAGYLGVLSGEYSQVLVLGIEKMTDHMPEDVARALMGAGSDSERDAGATFPALYALIARAHMEKFGTSEEDLASVSVKNHFHASFNPKAQFPFRITLEQALSSAPVATPLKLLDCSPITDGASAVVISSSAKGSKQGSVEIAASLVANDSLGLSERENLWELAATRKAAQKAYKHAGLSPEDIDIFEVHDCFSIAEIIALEDLGIYKKGEASRAIRKGETYLSGKHPVNTSGGLKACGHPVGATGVKQIAEIFFQLTGNAQARQVANARVGLAHNVGGSGATACVNIIKTLK